jgi:Chlorophyllase enzyme
VILYPADGPVSSAEGAGVAPSQVGRPFPLIVFAHGYDSSPEIYGTMLHAWASAGYVVAAPYFPRATLGGPLDENDVDNQPGDMSFVITKVLALAGAGGPLAGAVDPGRIGVAGHSDGASTTAGIGYNSCCRDSRVLADIVMEGDLHAYPGGSWFPAVKLAPLLVIQGDSDSINPPELGQAVYNGGRSPKYLLWLLGGQHLEPFTTDTAHLAVVEAVTTSFFDRYLKGRVAALTQMKQAATPGLATLTGG